MQANTDTELDYVLLGEIKPQYEQILTPEAIDFVVNLHQRFNWRREDLLRERQERQHRIDAGEMPTFLNATKHIRESDWQVNAIPADLQNRRVEITGPVDRRMIINALNSGAKVFMADFEDANSPTWDNCIEGQLNLRAAIRREIDFEAENGKKYALKDKVAVLKVRPRGWHLTEKHLEINGEPISASIFDFGLYFFHNAKELISREVAHISIYRNSKIIWRLVCGMIFLWPLKNRSKFQLEQSKLLS